MHSGGTSVSLERSGLQHAQHASDTSESLSDECTIDGSAGDSASGRRRICRANVPNVAPRTELAERFPNCLGDARLKFAFEFRQSQIAIDIVEHPVCPDFEDDPFAGWTAKLVGATKGRGQRGRIECCARCSDCIDRCISRKLVSRAASMCDPWRWLHAGRAPANNPTKMLPASEVMRYTSGRSSCTNSCTTSGRGQSVTFVSEVRMR